MPTLQWLNLLCYGTGLWSYWDLRIYELFFKFSNRSFCYPLLIEWECICEMEHLLNWLRLIVWFHANCQCIINTWVISVCHHLGAVRKFRFSGMRWYIMDCECSLLSLLTVFLLYLSLILLHNLSVREKGILEWPVLLVVLTLWFLFYIFWGCAIIG